MTTLSTIKSLTDDFQNPQLIRFLTGIKEIDRFNLNISPGKIILVGSRPSAGRSIFLLHLFFNIWKMEGVSQCFITNEESPQELYTRLAALASGVERLKLLEGFDPRLPGYPEILQSERDYILERRIPWEELREELAMLVKKHGVRVFYLDKIQGLSSNGQFQNRDQEVASLMQDIRRFASEYQVAIFLSSTLSRKVDFREGKFPQLADLRDSGAMEDNCDAVLLIHRPILYGITEDENGNSVRELAEVFLAKNRYGPLGTMRFRYNPGVPRFEEYLKPAAFDFNAQYEKNKEFTDYKNQQITPF